MKIIKCVIASLVLILLSSLVSLAQDAGWPRLRTEGGNKLMIYQPQVDEWKNFQELDWRMAVSITPKGGKPAVGIVEMRGRTTVDNDRKTVLIDNLRIKETKFPSLDPTNAAKMDQLVRRFMPPAVTIGLHQLVASIPKPESMSGVQLKNDPPVIYVSYKPAIILDVDGQPVRASILNGQLQCVINTRWPLFIDPQNSMFYLLAGEQWLTAAALQGPWTLAKKLPNAMNQLAKSPEWSHLKKFIPPPPVKPNAIVPTVFYSTSPAEMILFNGQPAYAQIPGTRLKYATNTTNYVFFHTSTNTYYYLTAGRWFSSGSLAGPWTFASSNLPADFANIPPSSPAGQVRASVPGTEEAKDAVLLAQVPTTVIVNPAEAAKTVKVVYVGDPQLVRIEGTQLYYIKNTQQTVIKADNLYYLCYQGIWFVSSNPNGPWQTAPSVPQVIYTIPPSSPVYNVTYVTQVTTPDGSVQASYTAGYTGVYVIGVATGVIITCGTGYYYPPYVVVHPVYHHPVYYPTPYTYGYMAHYHSPTGAYGVSQTAYGPYGSATRTASYNPYTGTYARTASVSTPYGSAAAGRAYNPYTGAAAATRQGSNAYASWGSSVVTKGGKTAYTQHYSDDRGTVGSVRTSTGGKAVGVSTDHGTTVKGKTGSGDMYASHDGNVYKNTGSGWQKYEDGSWNSVQKPASASESRQSAQQQYQSRTQQRESSQVRSGGSEQMQRVQQEAQNRQRGQQTYQRSQEYQRSFSSGSSGSSSRSFGGRGGRGGRGRR